MLALFASPLYGQVIGEVDDLIKEANTSLERGDSAAFMEARWYLAYEYTQNGQYELAQPLYYESLRYFERHGDRRAQALINGHIAFHYYVLQDSAAALNFTERAYELRDAVTGTEYMDLIRDRPIILSMVDDTEGALAASDEMIAFLGANEELRDTGDLVNTYIDRGEVLLGAGRYEEALGAYRRAAGYPTITDKEDENYNFIYHDHAMVARAGVGSSLYQLGRTEEAIPYLKSYTDHLDASGNEELESEAYEELAEMYADLGRHERAYEAIGAALDIVLERTDSELDAMADEYAIRYETERKDALIGTQENTIQGQQTIQQLLIALGLVLALTGVGLYFGLRSNRRSSRLLAARNAENELLLREVHHRVRNNLQTVSSLLKLQSAGLEDREAKAAMRASQSRVESMGLLHQRLYQGSNLSSIELRDYFKHLTESLLDTYDAAEWIEVDIDMEPTELDVDTAIPLGLIVNELITNSIKYAFPDDHLPDGPERVTIELNREPDGTYLLTVADNGVGKVADTPARGTGFGGRLVALLTEHLKGSYREVGGQGFTARDCFCRSVARPAIASSFSRLT